ncbi:MAG TPA: hypothetical protein VJ834_15855, partial [Burkholderiales bacterium]|nr:hypothetical protein [Burkholderiales bacterium]
EAQAASAKRLVKDRFAMLPVGELNRFRSDVEALAQQFPQPPTRDDEAPPIALKGETAGSCSLVFRQRERQSMNHPL